LHPYYIVFLSFSSGEFEDIMLRILPNISVILYPFFDQPSGEDLLGIPIPYLNSLLLRVADLLIAPLTHI
jgi:hypothetical protein